MFSVCCVLVRTVCAAYIAYTVYTMLYVISVVRPCSSLVVEPDVDQMNVGPGCVFQCIFCTSHYMLLGIAIVALGVMGLPHCNATCLC